MAAAAAAASQSGPGPQIAITATATSAQAATATRPVVDAVLPVALETSSRAVAAGRSYQRACVFGRGGRRMPSR